MPVVRYHWEMPGQMPHLDTMRLGKTGGIGHRKAGARQGHRRWPDRESSRVCIDDASRPPPHIRQYFRMNPLDQWWNSSGLPLRGMPRMGLKWRACLRTMAPAANWKLRDACRESGIKHKRTRPCRLQANGKAERFIRTALKERAYAQAYTRSRQGKGSVICRSGHTAMPMRGRSRNPPASSLGTG